MEIPTNKKIETIIKELKDNIQAINITVNHMYSGNMKEKKKHMYTFCSSCRLYINALDWIIKNELTTKKEHKNDNK